jgi:hypothetical protein
MAFERALSAECAKQEGELDSALEELISTGGTYAKLYDIEDWINAVAPKFPDVLICLEGSGEEQDDMWESRWKGDKYEHQEAIIPPFTTPELILEEEKHV